MFKCRGISFFFFLSKKILSQLGPRILEREEIRLWSFPVSFIIHEIYEADREESFPARLCAVAAPGAYFVIFQAKWRERERIVLEEEGRVFSLRLFEIFEINRS